jgi:hypothetical protein
MVVETATVVAHTRMIRMLGEQCVDGFTFHFSASDSSIQLAGVARVVLSVVYFHCTRIDVRFKGVISIRQSWEFKNHDFLY